MRTSATFNARSVARSSHRVARPCRRRARRERPGPGGSACRQPVGEIESSGEVATATESNTCRRSCATSRTGRPHRSASWARSRRASVDTDATPLGADDDDALRRKPFQLGEGGARNRPSCGEQQRATLMRRGGRRSEGVGEVEPGRDVHDRPRRRVARFEMATRSRSASRDRLVTARRATRGSPNQSRYMRQKFRLPYAEHVSPVR